MHILFGILFYIAGLILIAGLFIKIKQYATTPAPLKIPTTPAPVTKTGVAGTRLRVIVKTTDGFKIAEEDLALRGPGEFLGVKQSGFYQFRAGNLMRDASILSDARQQALELVETQPELARNSFRIFRRLFNPGEQAEDEYVDVL